MAYNADYIKDKLTKELEATHVEVSDDSDGCGAKFTVLIVSPKFTGKSLLQRQRLVNETLKVEMEKIHALSQKTLTPEQWEGQQVTASAPGKVILFGEHSVVYGKNAVAATLGRHTHITIAPSSQHHVMSINLPAVGLPDLTITLPQSEQQLDSVTSLDGSMLDIAEITTAASPQLMSRLGWWSAVIRKHGASSKAAEQSLSVLAYLHSALTPQFHFSRGLHICVKSELKPGAGTGSSAAYAVALAAALAQFNDAKADTGVIEQLAWKAEHFVHGKPSGLDTAISSQGGIIKFCRTSSGFSFMPAPIPQWTLRILLVDSCVERNTKLMVEKAKSRLDEVKQEVSQSLLSTMDHVATTAVEALQEDHEVGFSRLESLVEVNQGLLIALGVSHPSLDSICGTAARHGLHAKLTGAGGGGNAFILLPSDFTAVKLEQLQEDLKSQGFQSSEETLFGPGVTIKPSC